MPPVQSIASTPLNAVEQIRLLTAVVVALLHERRPDAEDRLLIQKLIDGYHDPHGCLLLECADETCQLANKILTEGSNKEARIDRETLSSVNYTLKMAPSIANQLRVWLEEEGQILRV